MFFDEGVFLGFNRYCYRLEFKVEIFNFKEEIVSVVSSKDLRVDVIERRKRISIDFFGSGNFDICDRRLVFRFGGDSEFVDEYNSDSNGSFFILIRLISKGDFVLLVINVLVDFFYRYDRGVRK